MTHYTPVYLPRSGPNDVTAVVVEWSKDGGQRVNRGEVVATAETTKSVFDIEASASGYLYPLVEAGAEAAVGAVIAAVSEVEVTLAAAQAWFTAAAGSTGRDFLKSRWRDPICYQKGRNPCPTPQHRSGPGARVRRPDHRSRHPNLPCPTNPTNPHPPSTTTSSTTATQPTTPNDFCSSVAVTAPYRSSTC